MTKKILVIRFSSIGDCIWVTPVLRCLKTQLDCQVHLTTKESYQELFECNPYLDKLHLLGKKNLNELISDLKAEKFNYIIDLHNNFRSGRIKWALRGVKSYSYKKLYLQKWLYVNFKVNLLPKNHVADRYFEAAAHLGIKNDNKGLDFFIPERFRIAKNFFPTSHQNGFVAFVIGASYFTKRLPPEKIIEFCEKISLPIVLIGGKEDTQVAEIVEKHFTNTRPDFIFNVCGKLNISQSADLVRQAEYVIGHDTGLTHIAACFQKKIYAIFGGTTPELGLYPYQTPHKIIENKELSCRPCSRLGKKKCPKGHFACMQSLVWQEE
ncbi:MAG: glycosyltransferase family 9 protein [Raineya sp.]